MFDVNKNMKSMFFTKSESSIKKLQWIWELPFDHIFYATGPMMYLYV